MNPFGDLVPGVNFGAAYRRLTGDKSRGDEDIVKGISKRGGDRTTQNGSVLGVTARTPTPQALPRVSEPQGTGGVTPTGDGTGGGFAGFTDGTSSEDLALVTQLRDEIMARGGDIDSIYSALFGDLDSLLKSRDAELEGQYGEQFKKAADQYTMALPEIENSYAAIGAADSTDNSDANDKAKFGYDDTVKTIGTNKKSDEAKLGAYGREQKAKITEDRDSAKRNLGRVGETDDADALRGMRNDLEGNLSNARVTRSQFGTDGSAQKSLDKLTGDNGRFDAAVNSLDSIIKSSMSGSVKEAAVKAITDNAGLSDEEKEKVQQQYGNVYAEQSAL